MDSAELMRSLLEATIASSLAIAIVLVLRRPLCDAFGARVGYALWWLVPVAIVAVLLPPARDIAPQPVQVLVQAVAPATTAVTDDVSTLDSTRWVLALWLTGAGAMVLRFFAQQRAFLRGLGRIEARDDGLMQAQSVNGLPAALGLWRPRIVVPADFDRRYGDEERTLLREHERVHIRHGDLYCNAIAALLRCVFWFNPLLHVATRYFRQDQELACDQRVIARYPQARRCYGEAMLKTQLAAQPLPLGCHWGFSHPLKERIIMLGKPVPSTRRWLIGSLCTLGLLLGGGLAAWAAQPHEVMAAPPSGNIRVLAELRIDDGPAQITRQVSRPGAPILINAEAGGHVWSIGATASSGAKPGLLKFTASMRRDGKLVATPAIVMRNGVPGEIRIGEDQGGVFHGVSLKVTLVERTEQADLPPGIRFDVALSDKGKRIPLPSAFAPFGESTVMEVPGQVRIEAKAMPPQGDISRVSARMYYYAEHRWVLDFDEAMDANIALTPSFEKTMADGRHRVVLMPRKVN